MPALPRSFCTSRSPMRATRSIVESMEGFAKRVPLAQDRDPREARLESLEADLLEEPSIVGDRKSPFVVVVGDVQRIVAAPCAPARRRGGSWHAAIKARRCAHADTTRRAPARAAAAHRGRRGYADLRRARALQPRRVGQPAACGCDRDPAQGGPAARARVELGRRGHATPRRRRPRARHSVASAVSHARRCRAPGCATRRSPRSSRSACAAAAMRRSASSICTARMRTCPCRSG